MRVPRPTYSAVTSTLALVIALSTGGAYAATLIGTQQIKNGAVTSAKIHDNTVAMKDLSGAVRTKVNQAGTPGPRGYSAWDKIPSGQTVTGNIFDSSTSSAGTTTVVSNVNFPAKAPVIPVGVGFGPDSFAATTDDPSCTGTYQLPTAAPGHVCLYMNGLANVTSAHPALWDDPAMDTYGFYFMGSVAANTQYYYWGSWAYTAP